MTLLIFILLLILSPNNPDVMVLTRVSPCHYVTPCYFVSPGYDVMVLAHFIMLPPVMVLAHVMMLSRLTWPCNVMLLAHVMVLTLYVDCLCHVMSWR